jgi:hypothetical protein
VKFVYFDESGKGDLLVMAGVIVDASRMHITKEIWKDFLENVSSALGRPINEFHTKAFYGGNGPWRKIKGDQREKVLDSIVEWWVARRHSLVFSAIDKEKFTIHKKRHQLSSPWQAAALHCVLALQKGHQSIERNKGHTVLIFDRQVKEENEICALLLDPPSWTDEYYNCEPYSMKLNQIIDVPYFVDSRHALLVQIADLAAYLIRRYIEIEGGIEDEKYTGEKTKVSSWVNKLISRCLPPACMYRRSRHCDASEIFQDIAPDVAKDLVAR